MKSPDISVVITNYNYGTYIRRCLRSLLNQDLNREHYELIVVDDHSSDDSLKAIEKHNRKWPDQQSSSNQ